ncbi:hypothetical protein SRS16CHR_00992 [Variovorax sp. SRS16]|uniref:DUF1266 domain-containing protein n=1 Tax=Variovorax sp. SRS16 TaxID=282217 RepID=UPI001315D8C2|nr:DUF1266 domain-containing protein [Variovorax sp. SRS16]VTU14237.1 hypothetical protein SRS16CHR_00992 [Variovorax sp. SRS16]
MGFWTTIVATRWARAMRFRSIEDVSPHELFGYLLSANLALLARDNFNQLPSGLSQARIRHVLATRWRVSSSHACVRVIEQRRKWLGLTTPAEDEALSAWRSGRIVDSECYGALHDTCIFLSLRARVVGMQEISEQHLCAMAWDIQQVAYLVRLGVAAGFVSRGRAENTLAGLQREARMHYSSWRDYSLSTLIGMGLRREVDAYDSETWWRIARSHKMLLEDRHTPISHAAPWGPPNSQADPRSVHSLRLVHASPRPARAQRAQQHEPRPNPSSPIRSKP